MEDKFRKELTDLLNIHGIDNLSNTPDFVLADYLIGCIQVFNDTVKTRGVINITNAVKKTLKESNGE